MILTIIFTTLTYSDTRYELHPVCGVHVNVIESVKICNLFSLSPYNVMLCIRLFGIMIIYILYE